MIEEFFTYGVLGIFAGLIAGMFGIGGGLIIVPILIASFIGSNFDGEIIVHLAIGTSMATIVFTGLASAYTHYKNKAVVNSYFKFISYGIVFGALTGALFTVQIPGEYVKKFIGILITLIAIQIFFDLKFRLTNNGPSQRLLVLSGSGIGFLSSILGIGGGLFTVPYLKNIGLSLKKSIGTSSACGIPIAIFGSLGYVILGLNEAKLPMLSFGYTYLPAVVGISITSVFSARIGGNLAHFFSTNTLRNLMCILLICIAFYMFSI